MINKEIFQALKDKYGPSERKIYKLIEKVKKDSGNILSKEEAANLLASSSGIDVQKILNGKQLETLRELKKTHKIEIITISLKEKSSTKENVFKIRNNLNIKDPLLPTQIYRDAKEMAGVYTVLYIFENSVRNLIIKVLNNKYGVNWWNVVAPKNAKESAEKVLKREKRKAYHGKRGAHPIYYTEISHLKSFITSHWALFDPLFESQEWIKVKIDEIEHSRNTIAHNNPLKKIDITRIEVNVLDWIEQIKSVSNKI
ncbi:hypothetical protein KA005_73835 [bacterium]|nr:hypothetical protein [bacterium]